MEQLMLRQFKEINIQDPFFDSLKNDYTEFPSWFAKKINENAYIFEDESGKIDGFLYLKYEDEPLEDLDTPLPAKPRLKIGTFKVNPHGTRLGERFIKKSLDHAFDQNVEEIYLTLFEKQKQLISLFKKYGFQQLTTKTTKNGRELVFAKDLGKIWDDVVKNFPLVNLKNANSYILGIYPKFHTSLFPDSKLINEGPDIIKDVSHTNSIHKVYLTQMHGIEHLNPGDVLVIYRTSDNVSSAKYRSVATSICVFEEYKSIYRFDSKLEFKKYCDPYSVFTDDELEYFWRTKKYSHIIRFTYNIALKKRLTRGFLIDTLGLSEKNYWGFFQIKNDVVKNIAKIGGVNEGLIVDQAKFC